MHSKIRFDVEQIVEDRYLFQVAGPAALKALPAKETLQDTAVPQA